MRFDAEDIVAIWHCAICVRALVVVMPSSAPVILHNIFLLLYIFVQYNDCKESMNEWNRIFVLPIYLFF